jgi:hypothetical protein
MKRRAILLHKDHPALLRARRRYARWGRRERGLYRGHRIRVEGVHGEAKTWHGLARAVRRGLPNMRIQAYLTAAAVNLKRLAAAILLMLLAAMAGVSAARIASVPWRRPRHPGQPSISAATRCLAIRRSTSFNGPSSVA